MNLLGDMLELTGYVNVVERDSVVLPISMYPPAPGPFVERVRAGAFSQSLLCGHDIQLKVDHKRVIGSTKSGALRLSEDGIGLKATVRTRDQEVLRAARRRAIQGWSFGFGSVLDEWVRLESGLYRRTLKVFELREVSLLIDSKPAYTATSAELADGSSAVIEHRVWMPAGDPVVCALKASGLLTEISKPN